MNHVTYEFVQVAQFCTQPVVEEHGVVDIVALLPRLPIVRVPLLLYWLLSRESMLATGVLVRVGWGIV